MKSLPHVPPVESSRHINMLFCYSVCLFSFLPFFLPSFLPFFLLIFFFKDLIYLFVERGEGKEKEGEKHGCERKSVACCLCPKQGTWPTPRPVP